MSAILRSFRNIWSHGEEDYAPEQDDSEPNDAPPYTPPDYSTASDLARDRGQAAPSYTPMYSGGTTGGSSGSPAGNAARRLRPVAAPLRGREKNIYTLRPTSLDEASLAADYLRSGSAVVLNLEEVDKLYAIRIIDFMSGVCYGLEGQGHAMKLGETIFLFTPSDFEISSDETDYGENRDTLFKDLAPVSLSPGMAGGAGTAAAGAAGGATGTAGGERRSWEH